MANSEKERRDSSFYSTRYGERRRKRHRKGQTRMRVLLIIFVVLLLIWIFLPHPTGDSTVSAPEDRTREFPITETQIPGPAGTLGGNPSALPAEAVAPNPLLEAYIGQELRESAYRFEVNYPVREARLKEQPDGTFLFRLAGRLYVSGEAGAAVAEEEAELAFRLRFFSNQPADYENFQPLFTEDIPFQVEGDHYAFQLSHAEALDGGLYYYLIEAAETGEIFWVDKVLAIAE